LAEILSTEQ